MLISSHMHDTRNKTLTVGICMRGRIFSDQKCPICGAIFVHDERRRGLFCPKHCNQQATGGFRVQFGRGTRKRFINYREAERFLDGLRFEVDQGTYDPRDYRASYPLGFETLACNWLGIKEKEVKRKSYNNLKNYIEKAIQAWGQRNIKAIGYGEIEDLLYSQDISDKTKSNMKSGLHSFFKWVSRREKIPMPEFPEISFELTWKKVLSKEEQETVVAELLRISYDIDIKIWLAVRMLCTYISVRPGEIIKLKEKEIDLLSGYFIIPHPKEKKAKVVPLINEDVELLKSFPKGLPDLFFFRHPEGISGCEAGKRYGDKYLYKWWKKACSNLGIEGVDLYRGTRHSSVMALRELASPEEIKRSMMTSTNKAFERYFRIESDEVRSVYELTRKARQNVIRKQKA